MTGVRARAIAMLAAVTWCASAGCGGPMVLRPLSTPIALTLPALDGGDVDVASLRGHVVVLHVFTTWSVAAQLDVEQLVAIDAAPDVEVVGIALDADGRPLVSPWRAAAEVHYLIALADDGVRRGQTALGPLPEVPTTIVLDNEGRIRVKLERQLRPGELARLVAAARR